MNDMLEQLELELQAIQTENEAKVDLLNMLGTGWMQSSYAKGFEYVRRARRISVKLDYPKGLAQAHFNTGVYFSGSGNYKKAIPEFKKALKLWQQHGDNSDIMAVYKNLGNCCLYESDFTNALNYYSEAINLGTELGEEKATADLYTNTGIIHHFQGHYTVALKYHLNALKTYERLLEPERMATSYTNIGLIYFEQKNYADALKTYNKALAIRTENKNEEALGDLHNNIGNVYKELAEYDHALKHHAIALNIRAKLDNLHGQGYSFNNLGTIYFSLGDIKLAWEYYEKSLEIWQQIEDKRGITECYINLGELFIKNSDYNKAEQYLQNARKMALETGAKNALRDSLLHLSELGAAQNDFKGAYDFYKEYSLVDKEIISADISRQLTQLTLGYEIEQKERETEIERIKNAELKKAYASLDEEKQKSESLLLNILPGEVATELKLHGVAEPRHYDCVSILFADIKNFTKISEALTAAQLISSLDRCFREFDRIVEKHGVEKIKVIGDAYMCAGGLPVANTTHAVDVIKAALEMQEFLKVFALEQQEKNLPLFQFRMGVHSGPVVAGIVGFKKFAYDIWGDTVNMAARMESAGEAGQVNVSGFTRQLVQHSFKCTHRGKIEAKNKGLVDMYFVAPKE